MICVLGQIVCAVLLTSACTFAGVRASAAQEKFKVAVAGPVHGAKSQYTRSLTQALDSLSSTRFAVSIHDDGCDANEAERRAKEIVALAPDAVLGHPCEKAAIAAARIYAAAGVMFVAVGVRHPLLTRPRAGPTVFRLSGRDDTQGLEAAQHLIALAGGKNIAVVHDRTLYAKLIADQTIAALKAHDAAIIGAAIVAGDKEYAKLAAKIKGSGAVFFAGFPMEAGFMMDAVRAANGPVPFVFSDSVATSEFTQSFASLAPEARVMMATAQEPFVLAQFAARLLERIERDVLGPFASASQETAARSFLLQHGAHTTGGVPITFDADGNVSLQGYGVARWRGGGWLAIAD